MSKDNIDELFHQLKNDFDVEDPRRDHKERFLAKLNNHNKVLAKKTTRTFWKPFLSIAASIILLITIVIGTQQTDDSRELASVSPEMSVTQDFFTTTIATELSKIQNEKSPEVQTLIADAMKQLNILEKDYQSLKQDLTISGDDSRVIYAMISNFQNRIDLLQKTLEQIKNVKQLNNTTNENKNTI